MPGGSLEVVRDVINTNEDYKDTQIQLTSKDNKTDDYKDNQIQLTSKDNKTLWVRTRAWSGKAYT